MAYASQLEQVPGIHSIHRTVTGGDAELSIISAATTDIGSLASNRCIITGFATITSLGTAPDIIRFIRFGGPLVLTHNATTLVLPTSSNINTATDDVCIAASDSSGNWRIFAYTKANGQALSGSGTGTTNLTTTAAPTTVTINSDTGSDAIIAAADSTNAGLLLPTEKTKLAGIATGATANSADATLLARTNHTGTQLAATISDFTASARAQTEAELIAGPNVTITPSGTGATRTLTITAASVAGSLTRQTFTATAGQTSFTVSGGYSAGNVDVYRNGVKLQPVVEVDISSGTVVTLPIASGAGDIIQVVGLSASAASNLADGDKGALTVSGTASVFTLNANVVTNAKLAQVSTGVIKGRTTAGTGDVEDLTVAQTVTLLGLGTYTHVQGAPASTWTIDHTLGRFPSVMVVDSGGSVIYGEVKYNTSNQIQVVFSSAFSGKAYLN